MPRSQRNQKVSLTKTAKKGRELKQGIVSEVRKCVDEYPSLYVFSFVNLRSKLLKEVRMDFRKDSRFFMGKNKVMILALGRSEQDEYQDGLREVSKRLKGQVRRWKMLACRDLCSSLMCSTTTTTSEALIG